MISSLTYCVLGGFNTLTGGSFKSDKLGSTNIGLRYFTGALSSSLCRNSISSPKGPEGTFACIDVGEFLENKRIAYKYVDEI